MKRILCIFMVLLTSHSYGYFPDSNSKVYVTAEARSFKEKIATDRARVALAEKLVLHVTSQRATSSNKMGLIEYREDISISTDLILPLLKEGCGYKSEEYVCYASVNINELRDKYVNLVHEYQTALIRSYNSLQSPYQSGLTYEYKKDAYEKLMELYEINENIRQVSFYLVSDKSQLPTPLNFSSEDLAAEYEYWMKISEEAKVDYEKAIKSGNSGAYRSFLFVNPESKYAKDIQRRLQTCSKEDIVTWDKISGTYWEEIQASQTRYRPRSKRGNNLCEEFLEDEYGFDELRNVELTDIEYSDPYCGESGRSCAVEYEITCEAEMRDVEKGIMACD